MKWFRRKKDDDEEFEEDFDFDDFDEEIEEAVKSTASSAEPDAVPEPPPSPASSSSAREPEPAREDGDDDDDDPMGNREHDPDDDNDDDDDDDYDDDDDDGDDYDDDDDEYDDDDDEYDDEEGIFSALDAKLAKKVGKKWMRLSIYGSMVVIFLALIGGGAFMFIVDGSDTDQVVATDDAIGAGGLKPPSTGTGGLNTLDEVAGEVISEERAEAGISAFEAGGGLNVVEGGGQVSDGGLMVQVASRFAYSRYPDKEIKDSLPKAPNSELLEFRGETILPLPQISSKGAVSWREYARPSEVDPRLIRVGVLITELGLSKTGTLASINKLPPEVTLSFSPYADELDQWMIRSRRAGHEVMLGLPLETNRFPIEDHGPLALKIDTPTEDQMIRLEEILVLLQGSIGVEVLMGSRFVGNISAVRDVVTILNSRGLMIVDNKINSLSKIPEVAEALGAPFVVSNVRLDSVMASSSITARLKDAERLLKNGEKVIITTTMTPAVMEHLQIWFSSLSKMGAVLVPVSSLVELAEGRDE